MISSIIQTFFFYFSLIKIFFTLSSNAFVWISNSSLNVSCLGVISSNITDSIVPEFAGDIPRNNQRKCILRKERIEQIIYALHLKTDVDIVLST
jgi:hypothetical protein